MPGERNSQAIAIGADGNPWFTADGVIGTFAGGGIRTFAPPSLAREQADIVAGPDSALWFTEEDTNSIGRITTSGLTTDYHLPDPTKHGPDQIALGADGNLWFTEERGRIGRITPAGEITEWPIPRGASPIGIAAGSDGNLWFTVADRIGRMTPAGVMTLTNAGTPHPGPIVAGPDQTLWFTDATNGLVGTFSPSDRRSIRFFEPDGPSSAPSAITSGPDGRLWISLSGSHHMAALQTDGRATVYPGTTGGRDIASSSDGSLWVAHPGHDGIAQIPLSDPNSETYHGFTFPQFAHDVVFGADGTLHIAAGEMFAEATMSSDGNFSESRPVVRHTVWTTYGEAVALGPDGSVWLTRAGGAIEHRTSRFHLEHPGSIGEITVDPSGNAWVAVGAFTIRHRTFPSRVLRITRGGTIHAFVVPWVDPNASLTVTADGAVWFVGDQSIGRIGPHGGYSGYQLPYHFYPSGLVTGSDGNVWFTLPLLDKVGTIDATTRALTFYRAPAGGSIVAGQDGALWFTDSAGIARMTTEGVVTTQYSLPTGVKPYGTMTLGADGNLWLAYYRRVERIDIPG
jgi:virginiamycin B lyase